MCLICSNCGKCSRSEVYVGFDPGVCFRCGYQNETDARVCVSCGAVFPLPPGVSSDSHAKAEA